MKLVIHSSDAFYSFKNLGLIHKHGKWQCKLNFPPLCVKDFLDTIGNTSNIKMTSFTLNLF
ncbi:hypothetical protein Hanom_Chr16g01518281 [Helianthus anomalus]